MLNKIIKHEFKATYRTFLVINIVYAVACILLCALIPVLKNFQSPLVSIVFGFGMLVIVLGLIFVIMSPFIFLSVRFYKTTATREAYLTFTVPAKTNTILLGKFIASLTLTVITLLVWVTGFLAVGVVTLEFPLEALSFDADIIFYLFTYFISVMNGLLTIFAAISLSQLVRDHRVLASFGFYMALYTAQQIVSVLVLIPYFITMFNTIDDIPNRITADMGASYSLAPFATSGATADTGIYVISIVLSLVFCAANYAIAHHMLNKKLNLL